MATIKVQGNTIAYELHGDRGPLWTLTPGGRFTKDDPGVREFAQALAAKGQRCIIWDRPNCGESDVVFTGDNESQMQADHLAGLLRELDLGPATITGGSGGARVSLLCAARHPDVTSGLAMWWISGEVFGLLSLAMVYGGPSVLAAWRFGMQGVVDSPEWAEVLERNPANRARFLAQDTQTFIKTMERWMMAYVPRPEAAIPGITDLELQYLRVPTVVFRSGKSDAFHTRHTSEHVASLIPGARLVEPPWGDEEWNERSAARLAGQGGLFSGWPQLVPQLMELFPAT